MSKLTKNHIALVLSASLSSSAIAAEKVTFFNDIERLSTLSNAYSINAHDVALHATSQAATAVEKQTQQAQALGKLLAKHAELSPADTLQLLQTTEKADKRYFRYNQHFQGLPVWGQTLVVVMNDSDHVEQIYGSVQAQLARDLGETLANHANDDTQNARSSTQAASTLAAFKAEHFADAERVFRNESIERGIFIDDAGKAHLADRIAFFTDIKDGQSQPQRIVAFVDADSGRVLQQDDVLMHLASSKVAGSGPSGNIKVPHPDYPENGLSAFPPKTFKVTQVEQGDASLRCQFDADNVETRDYQHKTTQVNTPYEYDCTQSTRNSYKTFNTAKSALNDAHYRAQITNMMYQDYFGEAPLGSHKIIQNVHYGQNMDQAFWEGGAVSYGDGDYLFYPMVALDVVAHEISHGFTENPAGNSKLMSSGQARAINESFSDMAGEATEFFLNGSNDWQSNYESYRFEGALRYLDEPTRDGVSIDHVDDYEPSRGAHYQAGVFSKAFHRIATTYSQANGQGPWNTKYAFILFANANRHCWLASSDYAHAADCVMRQASNVRSRLIADGVKTPNNTNYQTADLKNHIRKAFALVGVPLSSNNGLEAEFSHSSRFLEYNFTSTARNNGTLLTDSHRQNGWSWQWDFGHNGQTSNAINPMHSFPQAGTYTVTLTVKDPAKTTTDTFTLPVTVSADYCEINGGNTDRYYISKVVFNSFQKTSGGQPYTDNTAQRIDVMDGTSLNAQIFAGQPSSTKNNNKSFYLWIDTNQDGEFHKTDELVINASNKVSVSKTLSLSGRVGDVINARAAVAFGLLTSPCGEFSFGEVEDYAFRIVENPTPPAINVQISKPTNAVVFNNTTNDARISQWEWDFGDGKGVSEEKSPTYKYSRDGNYQVKLTALNRYNQTVANKTYNVQFTSTITPDFDISINDRAATFRAEKSAYPQDSRFSWKFGDGASSNLGPTTTHIYTRNGSFNVELTITADDGKSQKTTQQINIGDVSFAPVVSVASIEEIGGQYKVTFNNQTSEPSNASGLRDDVDYEWTFGDGKSHNATHTSFDVNTTHTYSNPGKYTVTLKQTYEKAWFAGKQSGSVSFDIELKAAEPVNYCVPNGIVDYEHIASTTFNGVSLPNNGATPYGVVNPNNPIRLYIGDDTYRIDAGYPPGDKYAENYHVWIDMNGDGDWRNDKSERVINDYDQTTQDLGNGYVEGSFTLSGSKFASGKTITRMRILQYFEYSRVESIDPCSDYTNSVTSGSGEIEDYLVEIIK